MTDNSTASSLHSAILNLGFNSLHAGSPRQDVQAAFGEGFKRARTAAAELVAAITPIAPAASDEQAKVDDLAALVRQLAHSLKKANPHSDLAMRAMDYLQRKGLTGNPLRVAAIPETVQAQQVATPSKTADLPPLPDAQGWRYKAKQGVNHWDMRYWADRPSVGYRDDSEEALFTSNQVIEYAKLAIESIVTPGAEGIRNQAVDDCAKVCAEIYENHRDQYKGRGKWANQPNPRRADPHADGAADGASECEDAILALRTISNNVKEGISHE